MCSWNYMKIDSYIKIIRKKWKTEEVRNWDFQIFSVRTSKVKKTTSAKAHEMKFKWHFFFSDEYVNIKADI